MRPDIQTPIPLGDLPKYEKLVFGVNKMLFGSLEKVSYLRAVPYDGELSRNW